MNIDLDLISCVLEEGADAMVAATEARVTPDWFPPETLERDLWEFIEDYYAEHRQVPSLRVIRRDFPEFDPTEPEEPLSFYITEISRSRKSDILLMGVEQAALLLSGRHNANPDEAAEVLQRAVTQMHTESSALKDVDLIASYQDRLDHYDLRARRGDRLLGIPTGIQSIDDAVQGLQDEQLIVLFGLAKAGKSSLMLKMGIEAHRHGSVPLFIGFEMSNAEQAARYDAMIAQVNHQAILRGTLSPEERRLYERRVRSRRNMQPFILSSDRTGAITVSGIGAKIEQYQPDVVFVDGVYLMSDEEDGRDERQQLTNITRNLKRLAQRTRKPIVISTQALRWKTYKGTLGAGSAGYSSSFEQDADVLLGVESDRDDDTIKRVRVLAARNARYTEAVLRWDWEHGTVEELFGPDADEKPLEIKDIF